MRRGVFLLRFPSFVPPEGRAGDRRRVCRSRFLWKRERRRSGDRAPPPLDRRRCRPAPPFFLLEEANHAEVLVVQLLRAHNVGSLLAAFFSLIQRIRVQNLQAGHVLGAREFVG